MKTLRIYGPHERALPFDLRDFLQCLVPRSLKASWKVSAVDAGYPWFDANGPGGELLHAMAQSGKPVSGRDLAAAAQDTLQVIWGEFTGSLPANPDRAWVVIRAIDSTFYEVITDDQKVLRTVERRFADVRQHDSAWKAMAREEGEGFWYP
ncbi:hypothetical protein [Rhizobium sp. BK379]|uniref:hypothetical protein n=1 Tax=Rhizobium sp. BK379 TaxID=2587059 RepID=UPI0016117BCE|nr:hypothetical protein [Rhizobium sp. BK379]MBB3440962.1 hypothetical protein [Rhizobium sp. BK379]